MKNIECKFPLYFENFEIPMWAKEQELEVFRACPTGKIEKESFLNSYEENNFKVELGFESDNPQVYSLSSYLKFRDIKRFATMNSQYDVPFIIAKGITSPDCGPCLETQKWKKALGQRYKGSHVDWWLYDNAEPWIYFREFEEVN